MLGAQLTHKNGLTFKNWKLVEICGKLRINMGELSPIEIGYLCVFAWNFVIGCTLAFSDIYVLKQDWKAVYIVKRKRAHLILIVSILTFIELSLVSHFLCY